MMVWEPTELRVNRDCNEDVEHAGGKEVREVQRQKVVIKGGKSNN